MKKLMLSCTLACFSLFGKKGIVDAYNNIPAKPQNNNLLHNVPLSTNTIPAVPSINNIENVEALTPAASTINTLPAVVSQPTNIINEVPALPTSEVAPIQTPEVNNLFSVSTVEQTLEKTNFFNLVPLNNSNNALPVVDDIANVPNIIAESPVLVVTNALPVDPSVIENVITGILNKKTAGSVVCYKIITNVDKQAQYVFVPSATYKNPLKNIYQNISDLVTLLVEKLQDLLCNNNNAPEINADSVCDSLVDYSENDKNNEQ